MLGQAGTFAASALGALSIHVTAKPPIVATGIGLVFLSIVGALLGLFGSPVFAFLLALGMTVAIWAARQIQSVVIMLSLYLPFEQFILKFLPPAYAIGAKVFPEALLYSIVIVILVEHLMKRGTPVLTPAAVPLFIILVAGVTGAVVSRLPLVVALAGLREFFRYTTALFVLANTQLSGRFKKALVLSIIVGALAQSTIGIVQILGGPGVVDFFRPNASQLEYLGVAVPLSGQQLVGEGNRIVGTMGRYDLLGTFLVLATVLALAIASYAPSVRTRLSLLAAVPLMGATLMQTFSRQSIAGFVVGIAVLSWITKKRSLAVVIAVLLAIFIAVGSMYGIQEAARHADNPAGNVFQRVIGGFYLAKWDPNYYGRAYSIFIALPSVLRVSPLWGFGPGSIGTAAFALGYFEVCRLAGLPFSDISIYIGDVGWVGLIFQYGLIGFLAVLLLFRRLWRLALEVHRATGDPVMRALASGYLAYLAAFFLVFSFFTSPFAIRYTSFYFWMFSGLIVNVAGELAARGTNESDEPSSGLGGRVL